MSGNQPLWAPLLSAARADAEAALDLLRKEVEKATTGGGEVQLKRAGRAKAKAEAARVAEQEEEEKKSGGGERRAGG